MFSRVRTEMKQENMRLYHAIKTPTLPIAHLFQQQNQSYDHTVVRVGVSRVIELIDTDPGGPRLTHTQGHKVFLTFTMSALHESSINAQFLLNYVSSRPSEWPKMIFTFLEAKATLVIVRWPPVLRGNGACLQRDAGTRRWKAQRWHVETRVPKVHRACACRQQGITTCDG